MTRFKTWLENANVVIVAKNKAGDITFAVDGKRVTYNIDAIHLLPNKMSASTPERLYNYATKHGTLISPLPKNANFDYKNI
jgi:hypothetical protein